MLLQMDQGVFFRSDHGDLYDLDDLNDLNGLDDLNNLNDRYGLNDLKYLSDFNGRKGRNDRARRRTHPMVTNTAQPNTKAGKPNPLAPVDYTPVHAYTPSKPSGNGRSKVTRDPAARHTLATQLEYQRSFATIALSDNAVATVGRGEDHYSAPVQATATAVVPAPRPAITNLGLTSPSPFPSHGGPPAIPTLPSYTHAPSRHLGSNAPFNPQHYPHLQQLQQPQQRPSSMSFLPVATYPQQFMPYAPQPYQPLYQPQQQQQQQYQGQQMPPQQTYWASADARSPPASSPYMSNQQLYSSSPSSSTSGSWSQFPLSNHHSGSFSTTHGGGIHGSFSENHYGGPPLPMPLSYEAQHLLDFNPGILSTIAVAFRQKMLDNECKRSESQRYGLEFPVTFTGKEAIDIIVELTKLPDRHHGLAIARSLEKRMLFFGGGDNSRLFDSNNDQYYFSDAALAYLPGKSEFPTVPTGVFSYSTKCYSYACVPGDPTCYSYLCPNRRHMANALGRQNSDASSVGSREKVWANSVPASIVASASKKERSRQEAIFEVINTEHNYVRDLELMEEIFINPLRMGEIVDPERVESLIESIFLNYREILDLNKQLLSNMRTRQEEQPLVETIGDVLLSHVVGFEDAYTRYIPRIALSEYVCNREEARNPKFAQFLKDCTRHPEARRLGLRHFVGQPYQRVPRYPLLLSEVVKRTATDVADREIVQEVINVCTELGKHIDACMVEGARQLRLLSLQDKIIWKSKEEHQDLGLDSRTRQLHVECSARRKATFDVQATELRLFLFDHMLLMTKEKRDRQGDKDDILYQVYKKPIPLELVDIWPDDGKPASLNARELSNGRPKSAPSTVLGVLDLELILASQRTGTAESKYDAPVTIQHRGNRGGEYVLYMTSKERDQFVQQVSVTKAARREAVSKSRIFQFQTITEMSVQPPVTPAVPGLTHPMDGKRVACSAPYLNVLDGKTRIVLGTENGVYVGMEEDKSSFRLAIKDVNATEVHVLEDYHILLVLSGKVLKAYNISCLEPNSDKAFQVGQQLGKGYVQYCTVGVCAGRTIVITMRKKGAGESHFSVFEPIENAVLGGSHHHTFSLSLGKSKSEWFRLSQEFYVASDSSQLHILSKMVCVVCPKGFEILNLENLGEPRVYPSKTDAEYAFLLKRPESVPVSMFKIDTDTFLMCYSDFAFTMSKNGSLVKKELIEFEGRAESFTMVYPYIIAFEKELIEVRHIETGALEQLILDNNIKRLYSDVDLKGDVVTHVLRSAPSKTDARQIVKMVKAPPVPKTLLEPVQYKPKSAYTPQTSSGNNTAPIRRANTPVASLPRMSLMLEVSPPTMPQFTSPPAIPQRPSPQLMQQQAIYTAYPQDSFAGYAQDADPRHEYGAALQTGSSMPMPMPMPMPVPIPIPMPMPMPMPMPVAMPKPASYTPQNRASIYSPFPPQQPYPSQMGGTAPHPATLPTTKQEQFFKHGCDNCESLLEMRGHMDRVMDCTSQHFDGAIAVMQPSESWVAKWQRIDKFEKGIYAVQVQGRLPEDIEDDLETKGIKYRPRDGSARD
ncbi:RHO1 GDP-GTP exchange protein 2 [Dissophora globulifera]|nr:RHO1 GDP-GTP exchange protein 2 [Dissophora globulifera]